MTKDRALHLVRQRMELEHYWNSMKKLRMVVEGHLKRFGIIEGDIQKPWMDFTASVQNILEEKQHHDSKLH